MPAIVLCVVDCHDAALLADFWTAALNVPVLRGWHRWILIGSTPPLAFAEVPDPTPGKNKMHVHLEVEDLTSEVERLVSLGATNLEETTMTEATWFVLADPEGNQFCVGQPVDMQEIHRGID